MNSRGRIAVFAVAVATAVATALLIGFSLGSLRDSVQFSRIFRRIEQGDTSAELVLEALEYARRPREITELMAVAWERPEPGRWDLVGAVAVAGAERFPRDERWGLAAALAEIRRDRRTAALDRLLTAPTDGPRSAVAQDLMLLAATDPTDPAATRQRLADLTDDTGSVGLEPAVAPVLHAVARAEAEQSPETLRDAWQQTAVAAYAVNGALRAASAGDRETASELLEVLRRDGVVPSAQRFDAPLYLAAWLAEVDWLFSQLRSLDGPRAVEPAVLLIQAEGVLLQGQLREARRFYRELQTVSPGYDAIAFLNDAAITVRLGDADPVPILREGLAAHPGDPSLRSDLAALLVARDRRLDAATVMAPAAVDPPPAPQRHRDWLLLRGILGPRQPLTRLESDLWEYLNDQPEAHLVAAFLARFLARRNDTAGMAQLRRRYPPEAGEWARTMHAAAARADGDFAAAERLLTEGSEDVWTTWYNRGIFALSHLPLPEAERVLEDYERWLDRGPALGDAMLERALRDAALLRAEYHRLAGDTAAARTAARRALSLSPGDERVRGYVALLARQ